jgi:hypothetical protein
MSKFDKEQLEISKFKRGADKTFKVTLFEHRNFELCIPSRNFELLSISPTFYAQLSRTKVWCAAFCTYFLGLYFLRKNIDHKMLVRLTPKEICCNLHIVSRVKPC